MAKLRQKISGSLRTLTSARQFSAISGGRPVCLCISTAEVNVPICRDDDRLTVPFGGRDQRVRSVIRR